MNTTCRVYPRYPYNVPCLAANAVCLHNHRGLQTLVGVLRVVGWRFVCSCLVLECKTVPARKKMESLKNVKNIAKIQENACRQCFAGFWEGSSSVLGLIRRMGSVWICRQQGTVALALQVSFPFLNKLLARREHYPSRTSLECFFRLYTTCPPCLPCPFVAILSVHGFEGSAWARSLGEPLSDLRPFFGSIDGRGGGALFY